MYRRFKSFLHPVEWGEYHGRYDTVQEYRGSMLDSAYDAIQHVIARYRKTYEFNRRITQIKALADRIKPKPVEAALQIEAAAEVA